MTRRSRRQQPSRTSTARRAASTWIAILAGVALAAGGAWWGLRARGPEPPQLDALGAMDPEVASLIQERIDGVRAARSSAESWGALGVACEANGFTQIAGQAYDTATRLAPRDARWWYRLALVQARLGDQPGALAAIDRVLKLNATYAPAHWRRGLWLLDQGDLASAERSFRQAMETDPADRAGPVGLARVYLARGDNAHAVETLERLLNDNPGDRYALQLLGTGYRRLGREDDAKFALAVGAGGEPVWRDPWSDEVQSTRRGFAAVLKEATALAMAGNFAQAIPLLERLRAARPDDVALLNHLGGVYAAGGRLSEAFALLESVLARNPENFDTHLNLATAHLYARSFTQADFHANRALAIRPTSAAALETKGMILWRSGRASEALAALEAAIARDPRNARARVWLGLLLIEQRQPRAALSHFEAALRTEPLLADALIGMGVAQVQLGMRDEAALALRRAEQVDPANPRLAAAVRLLQGTETPR
jgi:tetratricopeptide (TPR) repeat protein